MVALAYLLCATAALFPLYLVDVPALVDYPNHLARMHILSTFDNSPALARNYVVDWAPVPNLAMDAVVPLLVPAFGLELAGKIFIALTICLPVAGVAALHRAIHGRVGLWPLAAFLFVFSYPWTWGLLNYLFGVGLCLLLFAGWMASAGMSRPLRLSLFSVGAIVLYLCHFFAFAVYGLMVVGYEAWRLRARGQGGREEKTPNLIAEFVWSIAQFAGPAVLLVLAPTWDGDKVTSYGTLGQKLVAAASPVLSYFTVPDLLALTVIAGVAVGLLLSRRIAIAPPLRWPLALLLLAAVLMPDLLQSNWLTSIRLPVAMALVFVAAATWTPIPRRWAISLVAVVSVFWVGRVVDIAQTWVAFDGQYFEFRQVVRDAIPPGARVLSVQSEPGENSNEVARSAVMTPYYHLTSLAVIERDVFTPTQFTNRAAQPVQASPGLRDIDVPFGKPISPEMLSAALDPGRSAELEAMARARLTYPYWKDWPERFEYLLYVNWGVYANPAPRYLRSVVKGSFFEIFEIVPETAARR